MYIVLDLDECLVHTYEGNDRIQDEILRLGKLADIRKRYYELPEGFGWGVQRPHLQLMLNFCFAYFTHVCVWSAGSPQYVHDIVDIIFRSTVRRPDLVMTSEDCAKFGANDDYHKPLSHFFAKMPGANPRNTIFLDDRVINFRSHPHNGVTIPQYLPSRTIEGLRIDDDNLLCFVNWCLASEIANCEDITKVSKSNIFRGPSQVKDIAVFLREHESDVESFLLRRRRPILVFE